MFVVGKISIFLALDDPEVAVLAERVVLLPIFFAKTKRASFAARTFAAVPAAAPYTFKCVGLFEVELVQ